MTKRKICQVINNITAGGVESVLLNYFSHMNLSKYELDLLTYGIKSQRCADEFLKLGFRIIHIPPKRGNLLGSLRAMDLAMCEGHYDIVHAHMNEWNCIPMFLAWKNGIKVRISHSHMAMFPKGLRAGSVYSIQKRLNQLFATKYCACGIKAGYFLYGKKLMQSGKVQILNNAIDLQRFKKDRGLRTQVQKELGLDDTYFCIGNIGRFEQQKNHEFLIDIFEQLQQEHPDSCLLLLGTGELEREIHEKVKTLGLDQSVKFLGVRSDPERIYQVMDVFCLPSLYEGLPVSCIEAQAIGVPCVISDRVSEEVCITDLVTRISLEESPVIWADELLHAKGSDTETISLKGYNILEEVENWERLYCE